MATHAVIQAPAEQIKPEPHGVSFGFEVVGVQVPGLVGDVHATAPNRQGFAGSQGAFGTHATATQDPPLHTVPVPHEVPSALFTVTTQLGAETGVGQAVTPVVQGLAGWHGWFGAQLAATHVPSWQTLLLPHAVPFGRFPDSVQTATAEALAQVVTPALHPFAAWQAWPATQVATQTPARHTSPEPQPAPSATASPVSTHTAVPVEQLVVPW